MKTTKIQQLIKNHLLPSFEHFACAGRLMLLQPIGSVLRGIYFDDSSFSQFVLYAWVFVQPLYVPAEHLHFTFGHRLLNRSGLVTDDSWNMADEVDQRQVQSLLAAIQDDALPYLHALATPQDVAERLVASTGLSDSFFVREAVAYSLARSGRVSKVPLPPELRQTVKTQLAVR